MAAPDARSLIAAVVAEHMALASVAYLKAIVDLLARDGGSRGSYLVLNPDGVLIHPDVVNPTTGEPLKFKPENEGLRNTILQIQYDETSPDLFQTAAVPPRAAPVERKSFEPAWRDYREGQIYKL